MRLSRWSMAQLLLWIGTSALVVLCVPLGLYLTRSVLSFADRRLAERGHSLVRTLAGQIVDPILLKNHLALHDALRKAREADAQARYLCLVDAQGDVVAHTFAEGVPAELVKMWALQEDDVIRFRTGEEPLLDVSGRVLDGQLGTLHVGMSRVEALDASRRAVWVVGAALLGGLAVVLLAASFVAARVGRPLQELESAVLHLPAKLADREGGQFQVTGTREVESLARGFIDLADRLGALEKERAATQQQMIQAERMAALGEMAAGLAHEIHNPLDGMLECVRYLDADPAKSERMEKYLPMFRDGLGRIAQVMRHMLTLARSGQRLPTETKAVAKLVDELVLMTEKQLEARGVRLIVQQPGSCLCFCNANALLQAMLNLVLNACDAVDGREEREIRLAARCDSERVYLSVGDNGPGVPAELRERIFAPFFTRRPMGKGTGLGLSISRELVQSVGGELTLAETPSDLGGARFVVQLPRMPELENCCASDKGEHPHRG